MPARTNDAKARPSAARMREVAEMAGVSRMTVSRVMNEPTKVTEELRERVFAAVRSLGYVHNHLARNLSSQRSNVIGLLLPSLDNSIFSQTVKGLSDNIRPHGLQLMVAESGNDPEEEERVISSFVSQRVGGLVLHATTHTSAARRVLETAGLPVIETGDLPGDPIDMAVSYSNAAAAKAMTHHLARLGYRAIGLARLANNERAVQRERGYRAAMAELGFPVSPNRIVEVGPGLAGGSEAVSFLATAAPETDALFCAGDVAAVGALFECNRRGWAVPKRLAIASFDDLDLMRHVSPAITSLRLPRYAIGKRSAEMLIACMQDAAMPIRKVDLGFEIVQRASA